MKASSKSSGAGKMKARKTRGMQQPASARWQVITELRQRGRARNIDIARTLGMTPGAVGYILYQLRLRGYVRRIKTGLYEFGRMPDDLYFWEHEQHLINLRPPESGTMPEKIVGLMKQAPDHVMSFRALWKLSGLPRQVTGAVLSDLVRRGDIKRIRRGLYRLHGAEKAA